MKDESFAWDPWNYYFCFTSVLGGFILLGSKNSALQDKDTILLLFVRWLLKENMLTWLGWYIELVIRDSQFCIKPEEFRSVQIITQKLSET